MTPLMILCAPLCLAGATATEPPHGLDPLPATSTGLSGWRPARPADAADKGMWWAAFDDPVLDDLLGRVPRANQDVSGLVAAYAQARAAVREARAAGLPVISVAGGQTAGSTAAVSNSAVETRRFSADIGYTWAPDLWGEVRASVRQARENAAAAERDVRNAILSAQGEVALNYVQLRGLDAQRDVLDAQVAVLQRALDVTTNQYAAGVAARSDMEQARSALAAAKAGQVDLDRQRALLEHALAVLVGEQPSRFSVARTAFDARVPEIPSTLPSALLERRPDIAAAQRRLLAANAAIGAARGAFFPDLTLTGDVGKSATSLGGLLTQAASVWSIGFQLAAQLLDGGARRARLAQARAARDQSEAAYRLAVLTAFQQVEDALAAQRVLELEHVQRQIASRAALAAQKAVLDQYRAGFIDYSSVAVAQSNALTAQQAEVSAVVNRRAAAVALIQALGGGWQER